MEVSRANRKVWRTTYVLSSFVQAVLWAQTQHRHATTVQAVQRRPVTIHCEMAIGRKLGSILVDSWQNSYLGARTFDIELARSSSPAKLFVL